MLMRRSEREPGELRDSIETKVTKVKAGVKARVFTAFFGAFEELGTAKERPRPFLWPALEEHILELPDALKAILSEE
jgi:HK97 gp10 family phage protein